MHHDMAFTGMPRGFHVCSAEKRVEAAQAALDITLRKRDLGQINQVEFLDARNALTDAKLNLNVTRAAALARLADVEYAAGLSGAPDGMEIAP